jgi:ribosome-associated toxin RatA of RatAB toxin-antitoxin module
MSEVRQQVLIEASPEVVWELITDVNRHPEWWPDVEEVHCVPPCASVSPRSTKAPLTTQSMRKRWQSVASLTTNSRSASRPGS